jgi:hypothetical protein
LGAEVFAAAVAFVFCEALDAALPLFAVAVDLPSPFADALPDVALPDACVLPFCELALDAPLALSAGRCCPVMELEAAGELEAMVVLPVPPPWVAAPAELVVEAGVCCGAGGELAGEGGETLFAGVVTPASSKAAKGWVSMCWFCADAVADDTDEIAVEALGAILGTLGTLELRKRHQE